MLRISTVIVVAVLTSLSAAAQTTINESSPSTKSNSPDADKATGREHTGVLKPQNSVTNDNDVCSQWNLAPAALTNCRTQWSAARTDQERQKIRTQYEAVKPADPKPAHENTGRTASKSATTTNAPIR